MSLRPRSLRTVAVALLGVALTAGADLSRAAESVAIAAPVLGEWHERAFSDLRPIRVDLDGDGRRDTISPRITEFRRSLIPGVVRFSGGKVERLVTLDLETAAGRSLLSIFRFRFGTENGGYARFVLATAGDADGDGHHDLVFRVGGELAEELVVLLDRGDRFEARSTGPLHCACTVGPDLSIVDAESAAGDDAVLGRWRPEEGHFIGDRVAWVLGAEASIRDRVDADAEQVVRADGGSALRRVGSRATARDGAPASGWVEVEFDGRRGWISERLLSDRSPVADP